MIAMKEKEKDINAPVSWACIDCGRNTAPGFPTRGDLWAAFYSPITANPKQGLSMSFGMTTEVYTVRDHVWKQAGMKLFGGCLCIGCLEKRLGRELKPRDFPDHEFNRMPGSPRLMERRRQ
jgi:hypothetical protein